MSRFRCFDTYNLKNTSSSQYTTEVKRKTIFTEYQTIAIGNVPFQKGLSDNAIPPGYLKKDNGSYYYGPVYVNTNDIALNNCIIGAKNYELLYDVLFGAQPSPDDIKNSVVTYDGAAWQGNILKTDTKSIGDIGPAITNRPNGDPDKMNYAARQDFLPKYTDIPNPPDEFPGIVIDPCYNIFYPRCSTETESNNYIKNVKFNFTTAELENTELINYLKSSSAKQYKQFPYQLNFQNTTCLKYPFTFEFSFTNNSTETADAILLKYIPLINNNKTIAYDIQYFLSGKEGQYITFYINFKYTGAPSPNDGLTFYPNGLSDTTLVDFYNTKTSGFTIKSFDLIPLSPLGGQFRGLKFILEATDVPLIKTSTSLDNAFNNTDITLNSNSINFWRTTGVVSMNSTFKNSNFNGDLNDWNTSNVTDMENIFEGSAFNQPINNWDISKLTSMKNMFNGAIYFNQPLDNWDTSNVTTMRNLFTGAFSFNQSLNDWNTSEVRDMSGLFMGSTSFNSDIYKWNTENVLTMHSMFKNAISFNKTMPYDPLKNYWNTFNVETFESIFENSIVFNQGEIPLPYLSFGTSNSLNWINRYNFSPNLENPNTLNISLNSTFNAIGLTRENAIPFLKLSIFSYRFYDSSGTSIEDISNNYLPVIINGLSKIEDLSIEPSFPTPGQYRTVTFSFLYDTADVNSGLSFYDPSYNKINFYNSVGSNNPITILSFDYIPLAKNGYQFSKLLNLSISSYTIVSIYDNTSLNNAFSECYGFTSSNLSTWNVSKVINMSHMFRDTSFNEDISKWDTSNVTDMSSMFENNEAFNQDLSMWNTSKVTNMSKMFKNASSFNSSLQYTIETTRELNISNFRAVQTAPLQNVYWDVQNVLDMSSMFEYATSFNNGEGPQENTTSMNWILNPLVNLVSVRTGAFSLSNNNALPLPTIYIFKYEFYNDPQKTDEEIKDNVPFIINPPSYIIFKTVSPSSGNYKTVEAQVTFPNHIEDKSSGISFKNVTDFFNASSSSLNPQPHVITQFGSIPLERNEGYQFANLTSVLEFSANDVPLILTNTTLKHCFYNNLNFNSELNWDTSEAINMSSMFEGAHKFNKPLNFITNKVKNMEFMFKDTIEFNQQISYFENFPYWDVSRVNYMYGIFKNALNFNNGQTDFDTISQPLNWILNKDVFAFEAIKNTPKLNIQNAHPLGETIDRFIYTFYNTQNISHEDIINHYLPIIKTSDTNLSYYHPPTISINPSNNLTTVVLYIRYNYISQDVIDGISFANVYEIYNMNSLPKIIVRALRMPLAKNDGAGKGNQFANINNLLIVPNEMPMILPNTTFENIFKNSNFNSNINNWDISNVISLKGAFENTSFNKPLNNWNTSNVTDMSQTFYNNANFNQSIGMWNTSNVTTMSTMFCNCSSFNQNLSNWDTSKVTTFEALFHSCSNFNNGEQPGESTSPLTWNTNNLLNLNYTFNATPFNQDISGWNVSNVTTMEGVFNDTSHFNQPIGNWDTHNVINMSKMFYGTNQFNQEINNWDTRNVINMSGMFQNTGNFNKQISYLPEISTISWNTSNVEDMTSIFEGALEFNNGGELGDINHPLNWELNPNVNTTNAVLNTPFITVQNALPLSKVIKGNFIYEFTNNTNKTDEDISNNYIPIINKDGSFSYSYLITHPLSPTNTSFTRVDMSFTFIDNSNVTLDGLSFYDPSNTKVNFYNSTLDRIKIVQFGGIPITRNNGNNINDPMFGGYQFANLFYLDISLNDPTDKPIILSNTSFDHAFYNTPSFNSGNIEKWTTIFISSMKSMFQDSSFNQSLRINTKNVTNMNSMFKNASNFNKNISYTSSIDLNIWNTSNVVDMNSMFDGASSFNNGQQENETTSPLNWTLIHDVDISFVRINAHRLTNDNAYPLPNIYNFKYNFYDNTGVSGEYIINNYIPITLNGKSMLYNTYVTPNEPIKGNKSVFTEFAYVIDNSNTGLSFFKSDNSIINFYNNNNNIPLVITQFDNIPLSRNNGDQLNPFGFQFANLDKLDFSSNDIPQILPNTTLDFCFYNSTNFNSDINRWNMLNVISAASMFENDVSFNQPVQSWDTSNIVNMSRMFKNAHSFNQSIKYIETETDHYWDVSNVIDMTSIFDGATSFNNGYSPYDYDNSLNWILNQNVNITNSITNAQTLTDFNGLPLTSQIYYPNEFIYKFYNTNEETVNNILFNYLPFIKTDNLIFDISRNVMVRPSQSPNSLNETIITVRFQFTDDGVTQDGLSFNANPNIVYFYNQTNNPVEIIQFGGMPLSRYYKNPQQSFWETTSGSNFNSFGYTVSHGNNKWVSVGGILTNTILHSMDGINWSNVNGTFFNGIGYDVLYGGETWIAVGDDNGGSNTILRSADNGLTWGTISGSTFSYSGYGLSYSEENNIWVALGDDNGGTNTILISTNNGFSWGQTNGSFTRAGFGATHDGNSRWVAVGSGSNSILTSNDGINWIAISGIQFDLYGQKVVYNGSNRWVAIGHDNGGKNTILTSSDGSEWGTVTGTTFSSYAQGLAYGNGIWVAVGYDNGTTKTILTSNDGIYWEIANGTFGFAGYSVSFDSLNNRFIATGDNNGNSNTILTSTNGLDWFAVKGVKPNIASYGVSSNHNGEWVAVSYDDPMLTSPSITTLSNNTILYSSQ